MAVDGLDESALQLQRHVPDEAHQHRAHVVVLQQQFPQCAGEFRAELFLLELPDHGLHAVTHEHVAESLRLGQQPALQQRQLLLVDADGLALLKGFDLGTRALQCSSCVQVALQVLGTRVGRIGDGCAHRIISASQLAATFLMRFLSSGVTVTRSRAPGIIWATSLVSPLTTIRVFSNSSERSW